MLTSAMTKPQMNPQTPDLPSIPDENGLPKVLKMVLRGLVEVPIMTIERVKMMKTIG